MITAIRRWLKALRARACEDRGHREPSRPVPLRYWRQFGTSTPGPRWPTYRQRCDPDRTIHVRCSGCDTLLARFSR